MSVLDEELDLWWATPPTRAAATAILCPLCKQTSDQEAVTLCSACRTDNATPAALHTMRSFATMRLRIAVEAFDDACAAETEADRVRYAVVLRERSRAADDPDALARVNQAVLTARQKSDGLGRILQAESLRDSTVDDVLERYAWVDTMLVLVQKGRQR